MPTKKTSRPASPAVSARKPTIYDLARITGVSPGTVSRVLNNRDKVATETRERVLSAARELNLKPQVSVRTRQVAILSEPTFTDRIEGYAATLTAHLSFALSRRNIGVLLPPNPFEQLPGMFLDAIIAVTFDRALLDLLASLESRIPVIYMDKFDARPSQPVVRSDHALSGQLAARHFLARGRQRIAYLGGNAPGFVERLNGFRAALVEAEHPIDERLFILAGPEITHSAAVTRLVRAGADAIYAPGTSYQAMECLHILAYTMGRKVPQEISLIGGENEGVSVLQNPPLTTIEEPLKEMAEQAVIMIDQLTSGDRLTQTHITLPVRLIERDSVA